MGIYGLKKGILVTRNTIGKRRIKGKDVLFVPAWLFLLAA